MNPLLEKCITGDIRSLARAISLIENQAPGYDELLKQLPLSHTPITGITGPPGAGKSTLTDRLIGELTALGQNVAVLCVDPSSPFNMGAVLGDRIRMNQWYLHPQVFIRSLATRGSLGGLHPSIIEITDLLKAAPFDHIIVETVGVGQTEIEIAGLADTTVVVMVPEAGDEIQTMKAGLMEIADLFVVNKADRPGADEFVKNLRLMLAPAFHKQATDIAILKTVASTGQGIPQLAGAITEHQQAPRQQDKKFWLLAEKAYELIRARRMHDVNKKQLKEKLELLYTEGSLNLYRFVEAY